MAKSFIAAIQPSLTEIDAWNAEVSSAWESLFKLITFGMQKGFITEKTNEILETPSKIEDSSETQDESKE